ncbi:MAG: LPS export ABC transporter periplasmic protein LptC [Pseudomonadota bacterium]|mgnify:CR=1 FL=1
MSWRDQFHSRFVALMKIVLPLAALGILSTLFLFSDGIDPGSTVPVTSIDLQQRAEDQGATNATFAGVTRSGDEVLILTERSRPSADNPRVFVAEDVMAEYRLSSGTGIDITSRHAEMNQSSNTAELSGDVLLKTTTGYTITTDALKTQFDTLFAETPGPITGQAPAGDLTAGRMVLEHNDETGTSHLRFTDGVKLVYQHQPQED